MPTPTDPDDLADVLADPFEADEVKCKPQQVSGNRCLVIHFIDARLVMDRLDEAVGVANWKDHYDVLPDGNVKCTLSLRVGGEWVAKEDVGGPSEQPDDGDKCKAAFSDALKRCAVKWGIGRYLYGLPRSWADYDPQKRQILKPPELPGWARPSQRLKVKKCERKLTADGWCDVGELFGSLRKSLGAGWESLPEDEVRQAIREFLAAKKQARANGKAVAG